jgi:hypothetical protein
MEILKMLAEIFSELLKVPISVYLSQLAFLALDVEFSLPIYQTLDLAQDRTRRSCAGYFWLN